MLALGGIHSREWIPPDALVYWAADVLEAYQQGVGLPYGAAYFPSGDVKELVESFDLVVVPCCNPDGRVHSQTIFPLWRGNRNVVSQNGTTSFGVDLNRNYGFLWDFRRHFHPSTNPASDDPFSPRQTYCGPGATSEPEVRNIVWLLEQFPVALFVDVHSAVPCVLRNWGCDEHQHDDPSMSFLNAAHDGRRGVLGDAAYREFISKADDQFASALLDDMVVAISNVRGTTYDAYPAWTLYPTSGAGDDYAYSRHFRPELNASKLYAITVECGSEFQPPFPEAEEVMKEVAVGLLALANSIRSRSFSQTQAPTSALLHPT
jgi:murein tripeptide amidase MpaA